MSSTVELLVPTGLTLTVELYPHGSDTIVNTGGDSLTEATNRKGLYTATIGETLSGWHTVHVKLSGTVIAASDVLMVDGETCRVRDHDPKTDVAFIDGTEQTAGDIAAILAAIKGAGWTTETLVSLQSTVAAIDPLDATETQAAAAAAIAAAGIATAGGAFTQTVTVTTSGSTVPNAVAEIWSGEGEAAILVDRKTTNSSGIAAPTCDAGSYTLRVIAAGYVSSSTAITVTADAARAVALTAIGVVPPSATDSQCNAYGYVYDENGDAESGVNVVCELTRMPSGSALIGDDATRTETSGAGGLVVFSQIWIGGTYRFYLSGSSKRFAVTIDAADVDSEGRYPLPNFVG